MNIRRSQTLHPALMLLAPSLQLVLLLIFFLLLSTTFLLQPGLAVKLPKSPFVLSPLRNPRIVTITAPPLSGIYYENQEVTEGELRSRLNALRGRTQTVVIKADRRAFYERITAVTNIALELGFPVVLATSESAGEP